jgi:hypothetical protein
VYIPDRQHLVFAAHPDQHDRIPEPVWKRESHGYCGTGTGGDSSQHSGGSVILQIDGQEISLVGMPQDYPVPQHVP